jgi:hypothetical protein
MPTVFSTARDKTFDICAGPISLGSQVVGSDLRLAPTLDGLRATGKLFLQADLFAQSPVKRASSPVLGPDGLWWIHIKLR